MQRGVDYLSNQNMFVCQQTSAGKTNHMWHETESCGADAS